MGSVSDAEDVGIVVVMATVIAIARIIDRHFAEHGHEKGQEGGAVAYLIPVDLPVPGRATMDELVAKDVEPGEHETQHRDGIARVQGPRELALRGPEPFRPVMERGDFPGGPVVGTRLCSHRSNGRAP